MSVVLANNASGLLAQGISASDTQVVLTDNGAAFPALAANQFFYATLVSPGGAVEIVRVTHRNGGMMQILRGQENTIPQSFPAGSKFELRVTVGNVVALIPEPQIIISKTPPPDPLPNQLWLDID